MSTIATLKPILDAWVSDFEGLQSSTYEETPIKLGVDPLEAACVIKSLAPNFEDIESRRVAELITPEIKEYAEEIRKYYTKAWFWNAMSGSKLSPFRQRANFLLESRSREFLRKDVGIYVKLPWFYEEDMIHNDLKKLTITTDLPNIRTVGGKRQCQLEFLKTSNGWQGKRKTVRYWFKDVDNYLYGLELEMSNPLLEMFDDAVKEKAVCVFETYLAENRIDKMHYYKLHSYKLLKE